MNQLNVTDIQESYVISIQLESQALYLEVCVLTSDQKKLKLLAFNGDSSPISVTFDGLSIRAGMTTPQNVHCLGEIESVNTTSDGIRLEGDLGTITIAADRISVEMVQSS
jgi:hypothetical protein